MADDELARWSSTPFHPARTSGCQEPDAGCGTQDSEEEPTCSITTPRVVVLNQVHHGNHDHAWYVRLRESGFDVSMDRRLPEETKY